MQVTEASPRIRSQCLDALEQFFVHERLKAADSLLDRLLQAEQLVVVALILIFSLLIVALVNHEDEIWSLLLQAEADFVLVKLDKVDVFGEHEQLLFL